MRNNMQARLCNLVKWLTARSVLWWAGLIFLFAFATDQLSKNWLLTTQAAEERIRITGFMDFVLIWNKGISYGLLDLHSTSGQLLLSALGLGICAILLVMLWRAQSHIYGGGLALILGGAIGNITDRLLYEGVIDFISLHAGGYYWYIFNLADIWISLGVGLILFDAFFAHKKSN